MSFPPAPRTAPNETGNSSADGESRPAAAIGGEVWGEGRKRRSSARGGLPIPLKFLVSSHVVSQPAAPFEIAQGQMTVHQVPLGQDNLGWILVCNATSACALVDGPEVGPMLDLIAANGWRLETILNTHTHGDHVGINHDLARSGLLSQLRVVGRNRRPGDIPGLNTPVDEGDSVQVGRVAGRVWLTEGHIDAHLSFVFDGAVFCGDTLFAGGCGRLFDGPPAAMHASLQRLAALAGATRVCCGHEYTLDNLRFAWSIDGDNPALARRIAGVRAAHARGATTVPSSVAEERATNPFLRTASVAAFAAARKLKDGGAYRAIADADLPAPACNARTMR